MIYDKLKAYNEEKFVKISALEDRLNNKVKELEIELYDLIVAKLLTKLQTDELGYMTMNKKNLMIISELDNIIVDFNIKFQNDVLLGFAEDLLSITELNAGYYIEMGVEPKIVTKISKSLNNLSQRIGINSDGTIIQGSYLDNLSNLSGVKMSIQKTIINSITQKESLSSLTTNLKEQIKGNKEIAGKLQQYYKQYAFDTFSQVEATAAEYFADQLGLNYFIYQGDEVKSSRPFCKGGYDIKSHRIFQKKIGKVFSRKDAKKWEKQDWSGRNPGNNPLIDRGGYNCRHWLDWISDEMAMEMKGKKK